MRTIGNFGELKPPMMDSTSFQMMMEVQRCIFLKTEMPFIIVFSRVVPSRTASLRSPCTCLSGVRPQTAH
jgi:hypothetical protein